jgi:hypothetical protein
MTQEAHDFGLQLMTTVSTLVVAVAGFYFGSRAVTQATTTVSEQLRQARSYSRRGVIGTRPEPEVPTQEAPGESVENELAVEETEEDVDDEAADRDAEAPVGSQETGDEHIPDFEEGTESEPDTADEDGEPTEKPPQT